MLNRLISLAGLLLATGARQPAVAAQDQEPVTLRLLNVEQNPKGTIRVLASVTGANGRPVQGLEASHFALALEGERIQEARIEKASRPDQPLSVILAIDVSGSMKGEAVASAKSAAAAFLDRLATGDSCALMAFGDGVKWIAGYTKDRAALRRAVGSLEARDAKTCLYQAFLEAADRAATAPTARSAVVLLTDGKDDGSGVGAGDAIARLNAAGIPAYTLAFGPKADDGFLRRVATLSRGAFYSAPNAEELGRAYTRIADQLNSDYLLTLVLAGSPSGNRTLSVILRQRGELVKAQTTVSFDGASGASRPAAFLRRNSPLLILAAVVLLLATLPMILWRRRARDATPETIVMPNLDRPAAWLEVTRGPGAGQRLPLRNSEFLVGRAVEHVHLAIQDDPLVSGIHLRLVPNARGQYVAEDLGSSNGTRVNGAELSGPVVLQPNDRIQIGFSELLYMDNRSGGR